MVQRQSPPLSMKPQGRGLVSTGTQAQRDRDWLQDHLLDLTNGCCIQQLKPWVLWLSLGPALSPHGSN